jgi:hypothetical protein
MHHFILIQINKLLEDKIKINLPLEDINKKYGEGVLEQEVQGPLYTVLAKLLRSIAGVSKIIIPGEFRSAIDGKSEAI